MSLFDFLKVCVFTDVEGVVTFEGHPVSGAKVVRTAEVIFNGKKFSDETTTDIEGRFKFGAIYTHSINTFLPSEKMIHQDIFIHHENKKFHGWKSTKHNYNYNGELNRMDKISGELKITDPENTYTTQVTKINERDPQPKFIPFILSCELTNDEENYRFPGNHSLSGSANGLCLWPNEVKKNKEK
ncbi:DUF6795 domain-containing protein [Pseudomonadota bacterium]